MPSLQLSSLRHLDNVALVLMHVVSTFEDTIPSTIYSYSRQEKERKKAGVYTFVTKAPAHLQSFGITVSGWPALWPRPLCAVMNQDNMHFIQTYCFLKQNEGLAIRRKGKNEQVSRCPIVSAELLVSEAQCCKGIKGSNKISL